MRIYTPVITEKWRLEKERYKELLSFCRQYPTWLAEARGALDLKAQNMDGMPHGSGISNPVAAAAEARDRVLRKIEMVEGCARAVADGEWYQAIIFHVCMGWSYERIRINHPEMLKNSYRSKFFDAKRQFFILLDKARM